MSSLKALLNAKSLNSVAASNSEVTNASGRKRGAALEEWLLRKFPELYGKSNINASANTVIGTSDLENQPLNLVKRRKLNTEMRDETSSVCSDPAGHLYSKTLGMNSYNRVYVQCQETDQELLLGVQSLLPKKNLISLENGHFWEKISDGYQEDLMKSCVDAGLETGIDKPINLSISKKRKIHRDCNESNNGTVNSEDRTDERRKTDAWNSTAVIINGHNQETDSLRSANKGEGNFHLFAANKHFAKRLTTPKLTKHNDAAYYPNIQCLLCREWVCSRNRYMHVESHLQYRPYKCSFCGYDNRKEIFIILHIKKMHGGKAEVIRDINLELEHEAWNIAERCVEHTRDVLQRAHLEAVQDAKASTSTESSNYERVEEELLTKYSTQYRPKLYNTQRAEKSLVIEDSLKMGIVPDFSEVSSREVQCQICKGFVISHSTVMEEHTRTHLTQPSYRCSVGDCMLKHHSKNFLARHMKEVHKYKRTPNDITEIDQDLKKEFFRIASRCFPEHFSDHASSCHIFRRLPVTRSISLKSQTESNLRVPFTMRSSPDVIYRAASSVAELTSNFRTPLPPSPNFTSSSHTVFPMNMMLRTSLQSNSGMALLPQVYVPSYKETSHFLESKNLSSSVNTNSECSKYTASQKAEHGPSQCTTLTSLLTAAPKSNPPQARVEPMVQITRKICSFCQEIFNGDYPVLYKHVKQHLSVLPYECSVCKYADVDRKTIQEHIAREHAVKAILIDRMTDPVSRQCCALFTACFPDVPLQPSLHDSIQKVVTEM